MNRIPAFGLSLALTMALAACGRDDPTHNVRQTKFPGQVTSGGPTSGEVMARNSAAATKSEPVAGTPGIPQGAGGTTGGTATAGSTGAVVTPKTAGQEGERGQIPGGTGVAGTPGIPEGAGGTPSGAEMGGTSPGAAATQTPSPQQTTPVVPGTDMPAQTPAPAKQ
jgi:hypothetical protein